MENTNLGEQRAGIVHEQNEDIKFWRGTDERALLELNKTLITLSTGAIGVSVAVLSKKYSPAGWWDNGLLLSSWLSLIVAILFVLFSYNNHRKASNYRIEYSTSVIAGDLPADLRSLSQLHAKRTDSWTRRSQWLFVVGVILTIAYFTIEFAKD
jgi:hypothetical protein